ncbi:putative toxin, partial [Moraxella catarrhalis]
LKSGLATAIQGETATYIKGLEDANWLLHKIAHAAAGCAAGALQKDCESGAIGAAVGEVVAGLMPDPANGIEYTDIEKQRIKQLGGLAAGVVAAYVGQDVYTASKFAETAIENNSLVKLTTTIGKALVKSLEQFNRVKNARRAAGNNTPISVKEMGKILKDSGDSELMDIAGDILTIFDSRAPMLSRTLSAIDLVVGTDLNPAKVKLGSQQIKGLKNDKAHVQRVYQTKTDVVSRINLSGRDFQNSAAKALGVKQNTKATRVTTEKDGEILVIPDAFDGKGNIIEFKNVKYLSDTAQFRGYAATNKPIHLVINTHSTYSETIKNTIKQSAGVIQRYDPESKKLTTIADWRKR